MNPNDGYYDSWPSNQQPGNRRFLPVAGSFADVPPILSSLPEENNGQQYPVQYPHSHEEHNFSFHDAFQQEQPHIPLVPLNSLNTVEELQPHAPFTDGDFHDPFNRAYATNGPAVYEGFIPAPGREDEDEYITFQDEPDISFQKEYSFESSDEEDESEDPLDEAEEEERLREIEERDNAEKDKDYSENDAEYDDGIRTRWN